ncbi:MAG: hypothetical protein HQL11_02145 [Candidatus Omnitrophica bacterium]|nr:hypothetical protein [Candidatus Omnitrophota bacterium]
MEILIAGIVVVAAVGLLGARYFLTGKKFEKSCCGSQDEPKNTGCGCGSSDCK